MIVSAIAAIDKNKGLGKDGELLVKISADLKRFREKTSGHTVIMGRKTFDSIGKPLPNRTNIVLTRDSDWSAEGVVVMHNIEDAIAAANEMNETEVFIIGGAKIFEQSMELIDKLYLTLIDEVYEADSFFPDYSDFKKVVFEEEGEENGLHYKYLDLERNENQS